MKLSRDNIKLRDSEGHPIVNVSCTHSKIIPLTDIVTNSLNPNVHSDKQIELLSSVIKYQGMRSPLVVSTLSGKLVKGHGRLLALQKLGAVECPVDYQDYKDQEQEFADLVSDNTLSELSKTDRTLIKKGLEELKIDIDINLLGLKSLQVKNLETVSPMEGHSLPGNSPVGEVTTPLQIFQLDQHRLICGDCTSPDDLEALCKDVKADILFTSPPYNVGTSAKLSGSLRHTDKDSLYDSKDDNKDMGHYRDFLNEFLHTCLPHADYLFVNIQSLSNNKRALIEWMYDNREIYNDTIIWDKQHFQPAMAANVLNVMFEYIHVFNSIGKPTRAIGKASFRGDVHNIYRGPAQRSNEFSKVHNATFPNHLAEFVIRTFSEEGMTVLDPFCGTGTTLIECERYNRKCLAIEKEPRYCDIIIERWQKYTKKHAIDLQTGKPFNELKKEKEKNGNNSPRHATTGKTSQIQD